MFSPNVFHLTYECIHHHMEVFVLFCFNVVESVSLLSLLVLSHPQQSLCHCLGVDGYQLWHMKRA